MEIQGAAFEGPFIRREVVGKIGYPNKDLFIFCDDTDYCLRTVQAGFRILYVPDALMDKEKFFSNDSWSERSKKKKWKRFYQVRNSTYLSHHYGRNWAVRYLRGFNGVAGYILTALVTCPFTDAYRWSDIPKLWKAYCDGIHRKGWEDRLIDRLSECLIGQEMGIDCLFPVAGLHGKCFLVSQLVEMVFGIKRFHCFFIIFLV